MLNLRREPQPPPAPSVRLNWWLILAQSMAALLATAAATVASGVVYLVANIPQINDKLREFTAATKDRLNRFEERDRAQESRITRLEAVQDPPLAGPAP